ncbi:MAG TPA: hypothetical protein VK540_11235 [Polyangiaceae bacterium]|nr:hypothetical protein [Polyangiaceae bacterium]
MREDTRPETPLAKSTSDTPTPPSPNPWRRPTAPGLNPDAQFGAPGGARFDWAVGSGRVRTFQASGPAGLALTIVVFVAIGVLIALFFVLAIGVGTVLAVGAGAVAALGLGANMFRRRFPGAQRNMLGPGER